MTDSRYEIGLHVTFSIVVILYQLYKMHNGQTLFSLISEGTGGHKSSLSLPKFNMQLETRSY